MRAAVLAAPGRFELRQVPVPEIADDEVLVRVSRCGLCGTDIHIFKGHYSADRLPLIPGHEFSGHVVRTADAARDVALGTAVTADIAIEGDGAGAGYGRVPASHLVAIPRSTPVEMGALVEPVSCIVRAVKKSRLRLGESVLILGGGPIGNLHLQLARAVGAAPVIVSEPNPGRADWARRSGADIVVSDPSQLAATVREATEGRGADLVIESVGLPVLYEQAFELVRPGGRVLAFGLTDADAQARYHPFKVVLGEIGLQGSVAGMGDDMREAMTLIAHDRVRLAEFAETVYPLARIA